MAPPAGLGEKCPRRLAYKVGTFRASITSSPSASAAAPAWFGNETSPAPPPLPPPCPALPPLQPLGPTACETDSFLLGCGLGSCCGKSGGSPALRGSQALEGGLTGAGTADQATAPLGGQSPPTQARSLGSGGQSQREDLRGSCSLSCARDPTRALRQVAPGGGRLQAGPPGKMVMDSRHWSCPAPGPASGGDMVVPGHSPPRCPPPAPLTVPCPSSSPALGGLGRLWAWSGADLAVCPEPRSSEQLARWSAACSRFSHVLASRLTWQQTKR